jgi:hypothetical protein
MFKDFARFKRIEFGQAARPASHDGGGPDILLLHAIPEPM